MINKNQEVILSVKNLKKYFVNRGLINKAVDNLNFKLHKGEILGLIGESGSGKTTVGRTLIRLYEQFNGFVTLNNKIISGDKLNRSRIKMLRRNMQMIFQDPHASLNGQKTIYSILKEPLVVNGLANEWVKDLFDDWKEMKQNFRYTFENKAKTLEINNLQTNNQLAKEFFDEWKPKMESFTININDNFSDKFDELFRYLESKQEKESESINNMYSNTNELMGFFYETQTKYRSDEIDEDEKILKKAHAKYEKTKKLLRQSLNSYKANKEIRKLRLEYREFKEITKEFKLNNQNAYRNYISEFKSENKMIAVSKNLSVDLNEYAHYVKTILINKAIIKALKLVKAKVRYINIETITNLVDELKSYGSSFYENNLNFKYIKNHNKVVSNIIDKKFKFDYSSFRQQSQERRLDIHATEDDFEAKLLAQKSIVDKERKTGQPAKNKEDLVKDKEALDSAIANNKKEVDIFINKHIESNKLLADQIQAEKDLYQNLKQKQTLVNQLFDEKVNLFFKTYKEYLTSQGLSKKDLNFELAKFQTQLKDKKQTLQSFNIEFKYLRKDIDSIHLLLGIKKNFINSFFERRKMHWFKIVEHYFVYLFAKIKIKNLLIKNKIYKSLEDVNLLKQFAYRYPHEFSGGQRQRIVIARALISNPQVIIADEPIASLDISIQAQIVNLLKDLCEKKNIGLIFIAHDLSMVEYIADRILIMHLGKVVEFGITNKIYSKPIHPYTINLFKAIPKISNSNEKFQNISFELNYLLGQRFPNVPTVQEIEKEHYILATDSQFKEWTNLNKSNNKN